eukprot:1136284-Pelagomonas_calceolata.AAC.2
MALMPACCRAGIDGVDGMAWMVCLMALILACCRLALMTCLMKLMPPSVTLDFWHSISGVPDGINACLLSRWH